MLLVRVLRWLILTLSAVLLMLLGFALLWLTSGGLLESALEIAVWAAMLMQALALLCVMILSVCRAEGGWGWWIFLLAEALATAVSVACGTNWSAPGPELLLGLMPLLCAAALAGLNALIARRLLQR